MIHQFRMVNLLKFKKKAEYEDGRDTQMSGKQAYQIYAIEVQEHLKKLELKWFLEEPLVA